MVIKRKTRQLARKHQEQRTTNLLATTGDASKGLSQAQRDASLSEDSAEMNRRELLYFVGTEELGKLNADISLEREALEILIGRTDIKSPLC